MHVSNNLARWLSFLYLHLSNDNRRNLRSHIDRWQRAILMHQGFLMIALRGKILSIYRNLLCSASRKLIYYVVLNFGRPQKGFFLVFKVYVKIKTNRLVNTLQYRILNQPRKTLQMRLLKNATNVVELLK